MGETHGDRVDGHVQRPRARDHLFGAWLAGGVDAVRDHHHRPPALAVAGQVVRPRWSSASCSAVELKGSISAKACSIASRSRGERHDAPVLVVEGGQRGLVVRAQGGQELDEGHARAGGLELAAHAAAGVHQEQDARGESRPGEKCSSFWGRPSSMTRNSSRRRSVTGRPWLSRAVAERTTRLAWAEKRAIWAAARRRRRAGPAAARPRSRREASTSPPEKSSL